MNFNKAALLAMLCVISTGAVYAKLPAPQQTDEQKAKADEAKAKAADAAKKDAESLTKSQNRVAEGYIKAQKVKGVVVKPTPIVVGGPANAAAPQPAVGAAASPANAAAPQPAKK